MEDHDVPLSELMASSQEADSTFLRENIELCHTFAALAETRFQMGQRESAAQARSYAESGYAVIARLALQLQDPLEQSKIYKRLDELRVALDELAVIDATPADAAGPVISATDSVADGRDLA